MGNPKVTKIGIFNADDAQYQAVLDLLTLEIDQFLDILDSVEGLDLAFRERIILIMTVLSLRRPGRYMGRLLPGRVLNRSRSYDFLHSFKEKNGNVSTSFWEAHTLTH